MPAIDVDGDEAAFIRRARDLAALLWAEAEQADDAAAITPAVWAGLFQSGLPLAAFPPAQGGDDLIAPARYRELLAILRLLGSGDLSMGRLYEGHANAVALVCRYGSEGQVWTLAEQVRGGTLSAVWGAEDARGLQAERQGAGWRLRGGKILASGAGFIRSPLVTAKTDAGQVLIMLDLTHPGERVESASWTAQGMRSSATGTVDLDDMTVLADQIVGQPGDFMRQPSFSGGAWRFCAVHLGAAERLVDLFRTHLLARNRANDPYQLQRLAQATASALTARFWISEAARRIAAEVEDPQSIVTFVNLTRMVTERACLDILEAIHRGVGLGGFLRPNPIERVSRDLATYLRQPVPDLAMADAARAVLASDHPLGALWSLDR